MPDTQGRKNSQNVADRGASFSPSLTLGLVAISDVTIMAATGAGIYVLYVGVVPETFPMYMTAIFLGVLFLFGTYYVSKLYQFDAIVQPSLYAMKALFLCGLVFLGLVGIGFALKISSTYSRVWFFSWALSATLLIQLGRVFCFYLLFRLARAGKLTRNVVIIGGTRQAEQLLSYMEKSAEPWNTVIGIFEDRKKRSGKTFSGYPVIGTVDDLLDFSRENRVDDVVVTLPWSAEKRLTDIVEKLIELPLDIHLGSDMAGLLYSGKDFSFLGGVPMLDVARKPMEGWNMVLKGVEDRGLASILLFFLFPVMVIVAIAIKLESRGPVFFRQIRYGFNNQEFSVYKFRTMRHGRPPEKGIPQATKDDPRVTRIGAFLRRTSLDELPQFLNVIGGTMSLVGPRPHAVQHNKEYSKRIDGYFARHKVKPGITGWAQINGLRGETNTLDKMEERVKFDHYYIENWSLAFDMKIILKTVLVVLFQKTAY